MRPIWQRARFGGAAIAAAALIATSLAVAPSHTVAAAPGCAPENFKIGLDVGHTPEAPGATSARGEKEYAFNLRLARQVEKTLHDGGFGRTVLITAHGVGRGQLVERTARANAAGLDLLLSLHHDDVQDSYHSKWTYRGARHDFSDRFSGYSLFVSRNNRRFDDSLAFAKELGAALIAHGMHYSAHHAEAIPGEGRSLVDDAVGVYLYDALYVLKFSRAPAVLLEAGIIVNRSDELKLASPEGRAQIGAAVLDAVTQFCAARPPA